MIRLSVTTRRALGILVGDDGVDDDREFLVACGADPWNLDDERRCLTPLGDPASRREQAFLLIDAAAALLENDDEFVGEFDDLHEIMDKVRGRS